MTNQNERIKCWRDWYLRLTEESYRMACSSQRHDDYFTAYLYLFVTFNNLYSLRADFSKGGQDEKIKYAVGFIPNELVDKFYDKEYRKSIECLNDRTPEQFKCGPDAGAEGRGVLDMLRYFRGEDLDTCVKRIKEIANEKAPAEEKKLTLQNLAVELLYTIRNNQFHSIKGSADRMDVNVLWLAYRLLDPIVGSLLQLADSEEQA